MEVLGQILAYLLAGLGGIALIRIKEWYEIKRSNYRITTQINHNAMIREALAEAREHFDSDRVKLFQLKNGSYYHSGESEQKLTLTHIVHRYGTGIPSTLLSSYTDIPISHLTKTLQAVVNTSVSTFKVNDIDQDFFIKHHFSANNTSTVLMIKVMNAKARLIGVLMVTWREEKNIKIDKQIEEYMTILSSRIGVILSNPV